jgi:hypothetical protein
MPYEYGSRGPAALDSFIQKYVGYQRTVCVFPLFCCALPALIISLQSSSYQWPVTSAAAL